MLATDNHPLQSEDAVLFSTIAFRRVAVQVSLCPLPSGIFGTKAFRVFTRHYRHGVTLLSIFLLFLISPNTNHGKVLKGFKNCIIYYGIFLRTRKNCFFSQKSRGTVKNISRLLRMPPLVFRELS